MKTTNSTPIWLSRATFILALAVSTFAHSQTCDDFNCDGGPGPWTQISTGVSLNGFEIEAASCASGGVPKFVHAPLGPALTNNWTCDFEFKVTGGYSPAHSLVCFTEGGSAPFGAHGFWTGATFNYMQTNCIEAYIMSPHGGPNPSSWTLCAGSKTRTGAYGTTTTIAPTWTSCTGITLPAGAYGVKYYARIQRLNATNGMISCYSDAGRTVLLGSCCFTINASCTGLNSVQSGTHNEGSSTRWFSGRVDNIKVCDLAPVLSGPTSVCASAPGALFTLWNGNSSVTGGNCGFPGATGITWSGPAGTTFSPGTGGVYSSTAPGVHNECTIDVNTSGWVYCTVTYPCGPPAVYSVYVTVNPDPTSVITGPTLFCAGAPILLSGASSTNETSHRWKAIETDAAGVPVAGALWCGYPTWTPGPAGSVNIAAILPCLFPCGKYYKARLETKNFCATASDEHIFFVACPPTITVTGATTICAGSCTSLTASGAFSYSWSPTTWLGSPTSATTSACPPATQVYTVTGTNLLGCSGSTNTTVTVLPTPTVSLGPDLLLCCGNHTNTYTITPTVTGGTAPYTCAWTSTPPAATGMLICSHGATHTGTTCPTPWFTWPCPPSPITYTLTVTDANGCTATDAIVLTDNPGCRMAQNETDEHAHQSATSIYPNPATKEITVSTIGVPDQLFITDVMGRIVMTVQPIAEQTQIDVSSLSPGIYFVQVMTTDKIQTEQLIIEE